jgi:hypothetical protein
MTYAELIQRLQQATPEQLQQDVTVYVASVDEFYAVFTSSVVEADDSIQVLDPGHIYFTVN